MDDENKDEHVHGPIPFNKNKPEALPEEPSAFTGMMDKAIESLRGMRKWKNAQAEVEVAYFQSLIQLGMTRAEALDVLIATKRIEADQLFNTNRKGSK